MKPVDLKPSMYIDFNKEIEYQNIKLLLEKVTFQIGLKKFLLLKKLKILCRGHLLLVIIKE